MCALTGFVVRSFTGSVYPTFTIADRASHSGQIICSREKLSPRHDSCGNLAVLTLHSLTCPAVVAFVMLLPSPSRAAAPEPIDSAAVPQPSPPLSPILAQLPPRASESQGPIPEPPPDESPSYQREVPTEAEFARGPDPKFTDRRFQLETRMGIGTTVGELGLVGEFNLFESVAVGAGIGLNTFGREWGAHVRLRPISGRRSGQRLHALTFESAISRGQYAGIPSLVPFHECSTYDRREDCPSGRNAEWITWLQFELGWETRASNGFSLRLSSGYAFALNKPEWKCINSSQSTGCGATVNTAIPTFSLALGYAW